MSYNGYKCVQQFVSNFGYLQMCVQIDTQTKQFEPM